MKKTDYNYHAIVTPLREDSWQIPTKRSGVGLNLFCLAQTVENLNKKINCYEKYGLTSYLASCSTSLSNRKTFVAATAYGCENKSPWAVNGNAIAGLLILQKDGNLQVPSWSSIESPKGTKGNCKVSEYFYTLPENLYTNISPNVDSGSSENETSTLTPFKVSRDYVSSDASEGFEDWSFLDQKRPYDSLIRENIFELLEDLKGSTNMEDNQLPLEEHLFSSDINKTYANRLRLQQRIKRFYGLKPAVMKSLLTDGDLQYDQTHGVWGKLLKLEERVDVQLFRLNWVSSIAHARQILKHKHIGIINRKDRPQTMFNTSYSVASLPDSLAPSVASSDLCIKSGDLVYWRKNDIVPYTGHQIKSSMFGTNPSSSTTSNENLYKFPWFSHINASNIQPAAVNIKLEDFIPGALESGDTELTTGSLGASLPTPVFALANILGSIKISNESITVVTELDELNNHAIRTGSEANQLGSYATRPGVENTQLAKYFETHYKYTYSIRTSNSFAISYLRLPQSSIQKNEWKAFLESSI